jgi:hypothetical protein
MQAIIKHIQGAPLNESRFKSTYAVEGFIRLSPADGLQKQRRDGR